MVHVNVVDTGAGAPQFSTTAEQTQRVLLRRRLLVLGLNTMTVGSLMAVMAYAMSLNGYTLVEGILFLCYTATLPWLSLGFWNAAIGTVLLSRRGWKDPALALPEPGDTPIRTKTAMVMALRNEDPDASFALLKAMAADVADAGLSGHIDVHVLSDTDEPDIAAREERLFSLWGLPNAYYRRRSDNAGFKAGNLEEFCERCGDDYDFFLPLDADSFMSAATVGRLIRTMEANPRIGILQTLAIGMPATAFFTRVFQFGMRHGMRSFTTGSTWWLGDCAPYWGHNALIRTEPFRAHCKLPILPGDGPLSGYIMSHDQVEAVLMQRAGYEVRVIAEEGESWEENPPTLPDFIRRELRWCRGNMQYFWLVGMKGLKPVSRVGLIQAIGMYIGAPAWIAFMALCLSQLFWPTASIMVGWGMVPLFMVLSFALAPKVLGLVAILSSPQKRAAYGGRARVIAGGVLDLVLSTLIAPVVAFAVAVFMVGLMFGKTLDWRAQSRADREVTWGEALRTFWPQTLFGATMVGLVATMQPSVLPWLAPVATGLVLAIPIAVATAWRGPGRALCRIGLCDIPEDREPPAALRRLDGPAAGQNPAVRAA